MKCILCMINFESDETLKSHYFCQHFVNENDSFFKDLFSPDNNLRSCDQFMMEFANGRLRKNHMFLFHYYQTGGNRTNQQLPVNFLRRAPVKYFSINFQQHRNNYDFFQEEILYRKFTIVFFLMTNIRYNDMLK